MLRFPKSVMSFHFSVSNVLVLMLTVQAALATVVERQRRAVFESTHETAEEMRRDQIFQRPLSSEPWTKILGNPCRSPRPPPEGSLPENFHTLDLSGRLMEVYRLAGHMTSRLRHMKEDMVREARYVRETHETVWDHHSSLRPCAPVRE